MSGPYWPVFIDGPLEGKDLPVTSTSQGVEAIPDHEPGSKRPEPVHYRLAKWGFRDGENTFVILIAHSQPVSVEKVAEHLLSDYARRARIS